MKETRDSAEYKVLRAANTDASLFLRCCTTSVMFFHPKRYLSLKATIRIASTKLSTPRHCNTGLLLGAEQLEQTEVCWSLISEVFKIQNLRNMVCD